MSDYNSYTVAVEKGIDSCKLAAKELLNVLKRTIRADEDKTKSAVETKRLAASHYFHILKTIKKKTDHLILFYEEKNNKTKAKETKDYFEYLISAYEEGIEAIQEGLDDLLLVLEQPIDKDNKLSTDKLKSVSDSKKTATDDYFFLIEFLEKKKNEIKTLKKVERPEDVIEIEQEEEEKLAGYAERYAR